MMRILSGRPKPLDFGMDGVTGSVDKYGRLIAMNAYHPLVGYITLTSAAPFPEDKRYEPVTVREYRHKLAHLHGFGPQFSVPVVHTTVGLIADAIPYIKCVLEDGTITESTTFVADGCVIQHWKIAGCSPRWQGQLSLQRCAYTQLTEGGPLSPTPVETRLKLEQGILTLENPVLSTTVAIIGLPHGTHKATSGHEPVLLDIPCHTGEITLVYAFGKDAASALQKAHQINQTNLLESVQQKWQTILEGMPDDLLMRRALLYGTMLAIPVQSESVCILTDHMLLPLSWNRDAYYVAHLFLRSGQSELVRRHLIWMFEVAERPNGEWGRCYLANGRIKDPAFQLDQQLFPLLELAEYILTTDDQATYARLRSHIHTTIEMLMTHKAPNAWLFSTEETPADDPVAFPYHLSSHILAWHTFQKLAHLEPSGDFAHIAESIHAAIHEHFVCGEEPLFAYATDGNGNHVFYHDANDIPLVLAPRWGFTTTEDRIWQATVQFAFSENNTEGYYDGHLGSVHTRAPWSLGDVQALILARLLNDSTREKNAYDSLLRAAQWDGALPEAYNATTGDVISRHWFIWPNAAYAGEVL